MTSSKEFPYPGPWVMFINGREYHFKEWELEVRKLPRDPYHKATVSNGAWEHTFNFERKEETLTYFQAEDEEYSYKWVFTEDYVFSGWNEPKTGEPQYSFVPKDSKFIVAAIIERKNAWRFNYGLALAVKYSGKPFNGYINPTS